MYTPKLGMRHLAYVAGRADGAKADSKSQNETAADEHVDIVRGRLDTGSQDDEGGTSEHAPTSAEAVVNRTGEWNCSDGPNVVDGHDKPDARPCRSTVRG